jgi:anti-anti-sigma factor
MTKPTLKIEHGKHRITLTVSGDLTVQHSRELREFFFNNTEIKKENRLVLKGVTALDIAGIQLIYAWRNSIETRGGRTRLTMPGSNNLRDLLEKTGITKLF